MTEPMDGDAAHAVPAWVRVERALTRLQDVLERLPSNRALPGLDHILGLAGADHEVLADERARKLLAEAIAHRPLAAVEEVRVLRTEVELLTVEVGVLGERLAEPNLAAADRRELLARLERVRDRLTQLTQLL